MLLLRLRQPGSVYWVHKIPLPLCFSAGSETGYLPMSPTSLPVRSRLPVQAISRRDPPPGWFPPVSPSDKAAGPGHTQE